MVQDAAITGPPWCVQSATAIRSPESKEEVTMLRKEDIDGLIQSKGNVRSTDGEKIGGIGQIYLDDATGQPSWATVATGLFGSHESFVPLEGARVDGSDLVVPYSKVQVRDAPRIEPEGDLEPEEQDRLYQHYELGGGLRTYSETVGGAGVDIDGPPETDFVSEDTEGTAAGSPTGGRVRLRRYVTTGSRAQTGGIEDSSR
jgi:hypothetical protein